ncbi:PD-(D/E)XK nuclease-like domain-containing protein [Streptomyces sp. NPDC005953]|uniref:PD-(D/E)XK nuclease-like domain-containing protein n=1 Tax=Streptomyces sp. NPDC005953 TaxID=3156719 RepID=UPI003400D856
MTMTPLAGANTAPAPGPGLIAEPGLYPSITTEQYHADPVEGGSLSSTGARRLLATCPAIYRHEQEQPKQPKHHFDIGHAAHRLVLGDGPELVELDFADWRTKDARAERDAVRAGGAVPLLPDDYRMVHAMADALREHPIAAALFDPSRGRPEQTLIWRDQPTGAMCRARLDWLPDPRSGRLIIPDYKTCRSADPRVLNRAMDEFGYHQQDDWYRAGAKAVGIADDTAAFVFVCQEKTAPYVITVFEPDMNSRRIAAAKNRRALQIYTECAATGRWPGYADNEIAYLSLPPWAEIRDTEEYL